MDWPACSPDMNPIEHIWDIMSRSIHQRHVAPQTVQELADALVQMFIFSIKYGSTTDDKKTVAIVPPLSSLMDSPTDVVMWKNIKCLMMVLELWAAMQSWLYRVYNNRERTVPWGHSVLSVREGEGLVVIASAVAIPDSDTACEDVLYGASVEVGEDVRSRLMYGKVFGNMVITLLELRNRMEPVFYYDITVNIIPNSQRIDSW
ncbi:hypothetical protein NFI96_001661 [Prochilodus magdalenae]|nr:hypothetical protein NFI96_001661 [Prochilodus magdalenae]